MENILKRVREGSAKAIVWGAGRLGKIVPAECEQVRLPIAYFVDIKAAVDNYEFYGFQVFSPEKLLSENKENIFVIVAVQECDDIMLRLKAWGIANNVHINNLYHEMERQQLQLSHIEDPPLFWRVTIETNNYCNNDCSFCPANRNVDTRVRTIMSDGLFDRIIKQLVDIDYRGMLGISSNNEPLLDPKIVERLQKARNALPDAFIHLFTNGILLKPELFWEIIPNLDILIIDNYTDDRSLLPTVAAIQNICRDAPDIAKKVDIRLRKKTEVLLTRAGRAPNAREYKAPAVVCSLPFLQLVIRPDGKVSLCCVDAQGDNTLGDASRENLLDIWGGAEFQDVRRKLLTKGRPAIKSCSVCDAKMPFIFQDEDAKRYKTLSHYKNNCNRG